ncbi:MAG: hypothetical protein JW891_03510 [Candidatus Lokiarchaeota archaeon]|nr:hypothetical protein [Candidatus Lokiarchaeota archaeon]
MAKKDDVLVISLGRSPAVVPETIDALLENDIRPKRTYVVTTSDDTILNECIPLIERDFNIHYRTKGMDLRAWDGILSKDDIYNQDDNLELMINVANILKKEKGNRIFISMAGGRKTMSAAMALLAQIYNASAITHVLVAPEIETNGSIFKLKDKTQEEIEPIFHPDDKRLIFFPVIGISWMLSDMITILKGEKPEIERTDIKEILRLNSLLDEKDNPTFLGEDLMKLLNDIESYPPPSFIEPRDKIHVPPAEIPHAPKGTMQFVSKLSYIPFITSIRSIEFINSAETRIKDGNSEGIIICQYSDGNLAIKLRVETTARTRGQAEMVKKRLEPLFS